MKIEYLKAMHNARVGEILEVVDAQAEILIKLEVAKAVERGGAVKKVTKKSKKEE